MRRRRGQSDASGAATLLVIIAVMILLYLVFIPAQERQKLLDGTGEDDRPGGPPGQPSGENVLLSQKIGEINPPGPNQKEHTLPSFTIFTKTNAKEIHRKPVLTARRGIFTDEPAKINFQYNPSNTDNLRLSFNARRSGGKLKILLNGETIFNNELESGSPKPITLPESLLQRENTLTFKANSPGLAFWRVNTHELENIIVSGEVTDRTGSTASQHFSIPQKEFESMEMAELRFLPNCNTQKAGRMRISVNHQQLYSGFADCGVPNTVEIAKNLLQPGDNTLTFVSQQGQYLIDTVKVTTHLEEQQVPVYYFNIPQRLYRALYVNDALLFLKLRFTDARSRKTGTLNINGYETTFDTNQRVYQTQVNPEFLMSGPNSVMIVPQGKSLHIAELRVETS